jgi:hypothetical protein
MSEQTSMDLALERVEAANVSWIDTWGKPALLAVVAERERLTTDHLWAALEIMSAPPPQEPRAMGVVLRWARDEGLILPTNEFKPSKRPECHRNPKRVWARAA